MNTVYIENSLLASPDMPKPFGCFVTKTKKPTNKPKKSFPGCFFFSSAPRKRLHPISSTYISSCSIDDLSDAILSRVFKNLQNPRDLLRASQTCHRFRTIANKKIASNPVCVQKREVFYRYNFHLDRTEVYAMKIGRSIAGTSKRPLNLTTQRSVDSASSAGSSLSCVKTDGMKDESLTEILVPGIIFSGTITFEPNIDLMSALTEIYDLFRLGIVQPRVLRFNGGTSGSRSCSPLPEVTHQRQQQLDAFEEADFVAFVREMAVSVREVHLMNTKHFVFSKSPLSLLYLVDCLEQFSLMTSDASVPTIRFSLNDIFTAAGYWQHLSLPSTSCTYNIQEPSVDDEPSSPTFEAQASEVLIDRDQRLVAIVFTHPSNPDITLTYNFH